MGPKIFAYVDTKGRPLVVTLLQLLFGCLAFINLDTSRGGDIFNWLLALSGLSSYFVFGSIALAHIRFRSAWYKLQSTLNDNLALFSKHVFIGNSRATASTNSPSRPHSVSGALTSAPS
jgi:amino acid permease